MINKAMEHLGKERSAIRELFEQGKILKEKYGYDQVFDFSLGNPSVKSPSIVNDTLINILKSNSAPDSQAKNNIHAYTSAEGDKNVRHSISTYLNKKYNAKTDPTLIYMSVGAAAGLSITIKALTSHPDDEVLIFAPYFPEYKVFIDNSNVKCKIASPDYNTFYPSLDDFKKKVSKNTCIVIINSPNNPTGVLYSEDTIKKICAILKEKESEYNHPIYLVSDEPYRELIYNEVEYPFITNYYDDSIITYSFSKSLSLPGERIGYVLVNPTCKDSKSVFAAIAGAGRSEGYVCAPSLFQFMIPHVLGYTSNINIYKNNSNILYNELTNIGYKVIKPDGAFYLFVKALDYDDNAFSKSALKYNLLLVPSNSFGINGYVRIAYCVDELQIKNSIPSFKKLYESYQ